MPRPGSPCIAPGQDGRLAPGSTEPPAPGPRLDTPRPAARPGCGGRCARPGPPARAPGSPSCSHALAGLLQPVPGLGRPRFPRPALFRGLRIVALEPLLGVCARSRHGPARRTSGARGGFLRSPRPGGWPAYRVAAPRSTPVRRTRLQAPAARPRRAPWEARTGPRCRDARWRVRARPPPPSTLRGRPRPTPACFRALCVPVPPRSARNAPRARCNRSWRGPTAPRRGNRS